ncbi:MAG: MFS transporter [Sphingobium sp.]
MIEARQSPSTFRSWILDWALAFAVLLGGAYIVHVSLAHVRNIPEIFFLDQDFPALLAGLAALALLSPWASRGGTGALPGPDWKRVGALILILFLAAWAGRYIVFQDYSLSRDEEMAEFAAAYMRDGKLAWPIPSEWVDYRRAIVPEFFSPYGATQYWAATYLPVNSAIRAVFAWAGDANLAPPALLAIGLAALWHNARKLFPERPDAVWVVMLMGLTSAQLTVTAMTSYAMTGHFALNMVWLAFVLRDDWRGNIGSAIIALLASGLHQWHFTLILILGFVIWFALQRRWVAVVFHSLVCAMIVVIWAKLWPALLIDLFGPASDIRPAAGVGDKLSSLFARLFTSWYPLAYSVRFITWNNLLLIPFAVAAVLGAGWRGLFKEPTPVMPLALGCLAGAALMTAQVYGWGFRYMHGYIGSFCLLAGYGWIAVTRDRICTLRPVLLASMVAVCSTGFLAYRAHAWVAPYADINHLIRNSQADIVLVDARGSIYATDLARAEHGQFDRPLVLSLDALDIPRIDRLCAKYRVAIIDRSILAGAGIQAARFRNSRVARLRLHLDEIGCGQVPIGHPEG